MLPAVGMLSVIATWCLLGMTFFGCGQVVCRLLRLRADGSKNAHLSFWIGWATTIVILQIWHLWYPVDHRILAVVILIGAHGMVLGGRTLVRDARSKWKQNRKTCLLLALAGSVLLALWSALSVGQPLRPDTANYHLASVRWASTHPIVPGLGNLHHRLAFNNASFLYAAMLDVGPWQQRSHHLAHGLISVATILFFLIRIPLAFRTRSRRFPLYLLQAMFGPIAILFTYKGTSSLQPDLLTFLIGLVVASLLFESLLGFTGSKHQLRLNLFAICLLSSVGLTVKLSFLVFGCLASCIALAIAWRLRSYNVGFKSLAFSCVAAATVSILPWLVRHVVLSGYPLYPSTIAAVDVPWKVPLSDVQMARDSVIGYARLHGPGYMETLDNWDWVGPVIARELGHPFSVTIPLLCVILTAIVWFRLPNPSRKIRPAYVALFLSPSVFAVLFMMCTAPCPRFAGAAIWITAIAAMVLGLDRMERSSMTFQRHLKLICAMGLLLFTTGVVKASRYATSPFGDTLFAPTPVGEIAVTKTRSGLTVFVAEEFAWNASLPNTPEFRPSLSLRDPENLASGFCIKPNTSSKSDLNIARQPSSLHR